MQESAVVCNMLIVEGKDMNPEPWVSLEEVAEHLGVSTDTVHRWIRRRKMPAHKVGHLWKFKVSQVDAWVQAGNSGESNGMKKGSVHG